MISELLKSERMASNTMMLVSVFVHVAALVAIMLVSYNYKSAPKSVGTIVSKVKLVESGSPKLELAPQQTAMIEPAVMPIATEFTEPATAHMPNEQRLTSSFSEAKTVPSLQVQKRKKTAKKIEEPKTISKKNTPLKEPDNSKYLEKRLSELRSKMQEKKKETPVSASNNVAGASGKSSIASGDAQLSHWLQLVKNKVNTHWSLLGDQTKLDKIAVIGVQIAEDGKLVDASIDSSSGDKLFDNSALRAIFHAAPFPPIPQEVTDKIRQSGGLALRFTPGGMQ